MVIFNIRIYFQKTADIARRRTNHLRYARITSKTGDLGLTLGIQLCPSAEIFAILDSPEDEFIKLSFYDIKLGPIQQFKRVLPKNVNAEIYEIVDFFEFFVIQTSDSHRWSVTRTPKVTKYHHSGSLKNILISDTTVYVM